MDKKEALENAAAAVSAADAKRPNWLARRISAARDLVARANWLIFFNILLLALVSAMLCVMLLAVKMITYPIAGPRAAPGIPPPAGGRNGNIGGYAAVGFRGAARGGNNRLPPSCADCIASIADIKTTTIVKKQAAPIRAETITLPVRRQAPAAKKMPAAPNSVPETGKKTAEIQKFGGDVVIDGTGRGVALRPSGRIGGNLYLQNMRAYTLPCGLRVAGNVFVRNVGRLKFCGCFDIRGNIHVSSDSSFGPLPGDARLGGTVIF